VRIADAAADPRWSRQVDERTGYRTRSLLCVPLLDSRGQLVGVIQALNKKQGQGGGAFTAEDEGLLALIAAYAGACLENAALAAAGREGERLALVGKMATTIAHDIRNPLSVIAGYAQLLGDLYPDGREHAEVIVAEVERLSGMLTELLDFAREGAEGGEAAPERALDLKLYDLGAFLIELLRLVERDFQMAGIPILTRIEYHGPVRLDRNRLLRACLNVSNNAREAMGSRGTFTIAARLAGSEVELSFTDTGPGIAPAIRERIFQPFVAHGKDAGTGLGLAIARKIVEAHGGSIACSSGPGGLGTTFAIRLPAPPEAMDAQASASAAPRPRAAAGPDDTVVGRLTPPPPPPA
jgi:signal transduction histidine kinase